MRRLLAVLLTFTGGGIFSAAGAEPLTLAQIQADVRARNPQLRAAATLAAADRERIHQRIIRVMDPNCHAEFPKSRLSRVIGNVRILSVDGDYVTVGAKFVCHRYRRYERMGEYVGHTRHILKRDGASFKIKERRVFLKSHELGSLGSVSFIL